MRIVLEGFDWDEGNLDKCTKHGLTRSEVEEFFTREVTLMADAKHSREERRFIAYGSGPQSRLVLVGFTYREREGRILLRPISARYMHIKEVKRYEKETSKV